MLFRSLRQAFWIGRDEMVNRFYRQLLKCELFGILILLIYLSLIFFLRKIGVGVELLTDGQPSWIVGWIVFVLVMLFPILFLFEMAIRLLCLDNITNLLMSILQTNRERKRLYVNRKSVRTVDDFGNDLKTENIVQKKYLFAIRNSTVNFFKNSITFKVFKPQNIDAEEQLRKKLDSVRADLSVLNKNYSFSAVEETQFQYVIRAEKKK